MRLVGTMGQNHRIAGYKEHLCNVVSAYVVTYVIWVFLRSISLRKYYTAIQSMYISVVCFFLEKCYGTDVGVRGPCSMASVSYPVPLVGGCEEKYGCPSSPSFLDVFYSGFILFLGPN